MFQLQEYLICPGHGVVKVSRMEKREVGGTEINFYILEVLLNSMKIMIPSTQTTLRSLSTKKEVDSVYSYLQDQSIAVDTSTWNKRYNTFLNKIKTGSLAEIAEVFHQLMLSKKIKSLSFGERKTLDQCKVLLSTEISLITGELVDDVSNKLFAHYN